MTDDHTPDDDDNVVPLFPQTESGKSEDGKPSKGKKLPDALAFDCFKRNKGGRPRKLKADDATLERVQALGALQCTQAEAAGALGVGERTFYEFLAKYPEAREAFHIGKESGVASMRRTAFLHAQKSSTAAVQWMMNHAGWSQKVDSQADVRVDAHLTAEPVQVPNLEGMDHKQVMVEWETFMKSLEQWDHLRSQARSPAALPQTIDVTPKD